MKNYIKLSTLIILYSSVMFGMQDQNATIAAINKIINEAINSNDIITIQELLDNKLYSVDKKDSNGDTILMLAADNNAYKIIQLLINNGADVNAKNENGTTALMFAALNNAVETIQLLIDNGADVNAKNESGTTALMLAALYNAPQAAQLLINNGANINETVEGYTAYDFAQEENNTAVMQILTEAQEQLNA